MNIKRVLFESVVAPTRFVRNLVDSPAIVLLYHRVTELTRDPQQLAVRPGHFTDHLDLLRKRYNVLSVSEFLTLKSAGKPFPKHSILITFDDGYADNCTEALPILETSGLQALFFITTSLIGNNRESWWDELERVLYEHPLPLTLSLKLPSEQRTVSLRTDEDRGAVYSLLHRTMKYLRPNEREHALRSLRTSAGISEEGRMTHRFMTRKHLETMAQSLSAVLGAHTEHHIPLSILSREEQAVEMRQSKEFLEAVTGKAVRHFSYPYGLKKDFNADSVSLCRSLGFETACANYYGQVHRWTNPYVLPRVIVRDWPVELFEQHVRRFFRF